MPPSLLSCFSGNLDKLCLYCVLYAINVQHVLDITWRRTGMSRLNPGHFGRGAAEAISHEVDRPPRRFSVPAQLDAEATTTNGGTSTLIHGHSLSVDP